MVWYEMTLKVSPGACPSKNEHHHRHHPPLTQLQYGRFAGITLEVCLEFEVWSGEIFLRRKEG